MRTSHLLYAAIFVGATQVSACGALFCPQCFGQAGTYSPLPTPGELSAPFSMPQSAGSAAWTAGPEIAAIHAGEATDLGIGGQAVCKITGQPLGLTAGTTLYFPEVGSAYGAFAGWHYNVDRDSPVELFGVGAAIWSHSGYNADDYTPPAGEFSGLGGGSAAFQQGLGGSSGDAFGVRLGVGAALNRDQSRVTPYGEAGYDVFLLGDDFDNELRFAAGLRLRVGGGE